MLNIYTEFNLTFFSVNPTQEITVIIYSEIFLFLRSFHWLEGSLLVKRFQRNSEPNIYKKKTTSIIQQRGELL